MALIHIPSFAQIVTGLFTLLGLYYVYWQLTVGAARRRMIRENGCKPVRRLPTRDPIFGLDMFRQSLKNLKEHKFLQGGLERFRLMGNTFDVKTVTGTVILTIEPENLKEILSLQFKNWSLGYRRKIAFQTLLGPGIFATDGAAWQHSRDLLRPNFVRSQVGDLRTFETHVNHLIQAIPRDGSTVNLQDLFFRLTIDSATEFLFGESTNCLAPGTSTESNTKFADAFNRSQDAIGRHARFGPLGVLIPDPQFARDAKYVHAFVDDLVEKCMARREVQDPEKGDGRYVFLQQLVTQTQDKYQIRSELLNVLLAGRDTTASLLR